MPAPGRTASSRRTNQTGPPHGHQQHRREKTKSSPSYLQHRRNESSSQPAPLRPTANSRAAHPTRPVLKGRTNSAPTVPNGQPTKPEQAAQTAGEGPASDPVAEDEEEVIQQDIADDPFFQRLSSSTQADQQPQTDETRSIGSADDSTDTEGPLSPTSTQMKPRPDSTAEPLGSPLSPRSPVEWQENSPRMQEINIAVLGSPKAGKSAFVQHVLDLRTAPTTAFAHRKMAIDGNVYVVRLVELTYDDLELDGEKRISWPEVLHGTPMPIIDGALTLYDVMNRESLVQLPGTLSGIYNASIPSLLVACKCDNPSSRRLVDPAVVEQRAKALIGDVTAFQTSYKTPDSQKRCVAMLLRSIVSVRKQHLHLAAARRRAHSSAARHVPRQSTSHGHQRASSEVSTSTMSGQAGRQDGRGAVSAKLPSQQSPLEPPSRRGYHDFDKPPDADARDAQQPSSPAKVQQSSPKFDKIIKTPSDAGSTFDDLVDRLLAQQLSKQDTKFAAVFLALYRNFAAPAELLEAILDRFDDATRSANPQMTKTQMQLRHLGILDSWLATYPGDFAHRSTRKRLEKFIVAIASVRLFSFAAKELLANLDQVVEDDDTDWAFCDRNREKATTLAGAKLAEDVVGLAITRDDTPPQSPSTIRSSINSTSASSTQALIDKVETAGRLARGLVPTARFALTKMQWRALMDTPEEVIAKELTRMDWIMFVSIRPRDLVRHVSLPASAKAKCRSLENVQRMIDHFNHLAVWVANFVLLRDKPKHRALMLEKFMKIARELRKLNNYNALGAVLAGVNSTAVQRLQATKDLVPPTTSKDFLKLEILMSSQKSHFAYRLAWENTPGARVPYLPLHRRDLVTASAGNRTFTGFDDKEQEERWLRGESTRDVRINWKKFEIMGEVIVSMQRAQSQPDPLAGLGKNDEVRSLVTDTEILKDDDALYDRSVAVEPAGAGAGSNKRRFQWFQASGLSAAFP